MTTSRSTADILQQQLRDSGFIVAEIALKGRFHSSANLEDTEVLIKLCNSRSEFQFRDSLPSKQSNGPHTTDDFGPRRKPHADILRSILVTQSTWYQAFSTLLSSMSTTNESAIISFGTERCIPPSLSRTLGPRNIRVIEAESENESQPIKPNGLNASSTLTNNFMDQQVAVVGMSCLVPGAADLEEFSQLLQSGKSQHQEVPLDRFGFQTAWRDQDPKRTWYGNFIQDFDTFDHKFFKKSPREMESTDPQHRLMLQVAYQAVQQSGYFHFPDRDKHIGCYVGVGLVDYENNIACYPANAYSATGNLKSFAAGKISHYFGWTGPGLTIDTACSSSAVAIHQACRAIQTGDCSAALAGGINLMTSPEWFQNLAGASFLSPTGQCKPFDSKADGYCRGEGVGAVFLKRLSAAVADGDQIMGIIGGTNVYQNQNCTAITVPNAVSLSDLFSNVVQKAGLEAKQVTIVEAHGTGTQVGDPAEYESVRKVFGGSVERQKPLSLGSVKGLLGHTESASGIVALIKILVMIVEGFIPPQPSFEKINPAIHASPSDNIEIKTKLQPWDEAFRAALINNYGASGSNASLVVTQAIRPPTQGLSREIRALASTTKHPFWFSGVDDQGLRTYITRFRRFLQAQHASGKLLSIANLSFQVYRQSNRSLRQALIFSCSTVNELEEKLAAFIDGRREVTSIAVPPARPVILCFGGQISTFIGLDRQVYDNTSILRYYLDQCDSIYQSLGLTGIYPEIFQRKPVKDLVKLQSMLFAIQFACAKSWMECGIQVAAVVGHSFGELTALCISGALSLRDTIKLVVGRARLIQEYWGPEKGSMLAVDGDLEIVARLLAESNVNFTPEAQATIACYNGPRCFTLSGSTKSVEAAVDVAYKSSSYSSLKLKKLNVTNAFHSNLVEPLMAGLEEIGQEINFKEPAIRLELATQSESSGLLTASYSANHMRNPVYYNHAVQRLSKLYESCIWLEAGSNSTVTTLASRALGQPPSSHFQPMNITSDSSFQFLADATTSLWRGGINVAFWSHHTSQTSQYPPMFLPPHQFEKSKHWMELKRPQKVNDQPVIIQEAMPVGLWTFVGYQDKISRNARFRINTMTKEFEEFLLGHVIVQTASLCPSVLQLQIIVDALTSLVPNAKNSRVQPQLQVLQSHAPMGLDPSIYVWLDAEAADSDALEWDFQIVSNGAEAKSPSVKHVSGKLVFKADNHPNVQAEFAKLERFVSMKRCLSLLNGDDVDEVIQGRNIYKSFLEIVKYSDTFKCAQKIVGKDNESAGRVSRKGTSKTLIDTGLFDSICQIAGIFVNCMTDVPDGDMYISDRIDQWIRSPRTRAEEWPEVLNVFCCHQRPSDKQYISDIFVFDPRNGALLEVILGVNYQRIPKDTMRKVLLKVTPGAKASLPVAATSTPVKLEVLSVEPITVGSMPAKPAPPKPKQAVRPDISPKVRSLVSLLSGLEPEEILDESELGDLGIDSLMGMELAREVETTFKCTLDQDELLGLTDFRSLISCIKKALGDDTPDDDDGIEEPASEDESLKVKVDTARIDSITAHVNGSNGYMNGTSRSSELPAGVILESFKQVKESTDQFIIDSKLSGYVDEVMPKLNELCVVHILDAFDELGCSIRNAKSGETIKRIEYLPRHEQFVDFVYDFLERTARLVDIKGSQIVRTAVSCTARSVDAVMEELARVAPDHIYDSKLTYITGVKLADCLTGKSDALQLIFGTPEGREIAAGMYSKSPINVAWIRQMQEFLRRTLSALPKDGSPIKILEMGAGTGGTTSALIPLLASLNVPLEYMVTDLSSSLVANARKRFKEFSFAKFKTLDIEKPPSQDLLRSQHIVIATNCVHATHKLVDSTKNIHDLLRPDGMLMMLEMTETLPWIDLIFGLVEGWWLFDDGRRHALVQPSVWEQTLKQVGYGHVDWTEGSQPEASIQRVIIALASEARYERAPPSLSPPKSIDTDFAARQIVIDSYIEKYTRNFTLHRPATSSDLSSTSEGWGVLVTGATGSLGAHLVSHLVSLPIIKTVVCLNRNSQKDPLGRQLEAFESKGIKLDQDSLSKIKAFDTDASRPRLGLSTNDYDFLLQHITHIVHNAWPMSITRPITAFESQFKTMANLIDLANEASSIHQCQVGFQFISSIATVGYHPLWTGNYLVPEEPMIAQSVLPTGYGDAKLVCEHMLTQTLTKHPDRFRAMSVRIGQISGSEISGHWNPVEHLAFLIKSCHTLKLLPDFEGVGPALPLPLIPNLHTNARTQTLSWCPVTTVSSTLSDLLLSPHPTPSYPIYHIENPTRQSWKSMIVTLAKELDIPTSNIVPFETWTRDVRQFPGSTEKDNPAKKLVRFLEEHFVRMSCGGLVLDTERAREYSETLRGSREVGEELVRRYLGGWRKAGFLRG